MPSSFLTSWRQMNRTRPAVTNADTNLVKKQEIPSKYSTVYIWQYLCILHNISTVQVLHKYNIQEKESSKHDALLQQEHNNGKKPFTFPYCWHPHLGPSMSTHPSLGRPSPQNTHHSLNLSTWRRYMLLVVHMFSSTRSRAAWAINWLRWWWSSFCIQTHTHNYSTVRKV